MTMESHKRKAGAHQPPAFISKPFTYDGLERDDRVYRRRTQEASDNLRRAIIRYQNKRAGVTFG